PWRSRRSTGGLETRREPARRPTTRFRPRLEMVERREVLSTLTVTSAADDGSAGTPRAEGAPAHGGGPPRFAPPPHSPTIALGGGELVLKTSLTIQGPCASQLAVSGGDASRVFEVDGASTNVTLSGLTITHGNGLGGADPGEGGGVFNNGSTLTLSGCTL